MSKLALPILLCLLLIASWCASPASGDSAKIDPQSCTYAGKPLFGKVQIVSSAPDVKVATVSSLEDLRVQIVSSFPDRCGKWQLVNSFPNLKVQFVKSFPDIKIKFVESFPGLR